MQLQGGRSLGEEHVTINSCKSYASIVPRNKNLCSSTVSRHLQDACVCAEMWVKILSIPACASCCGQPRLLCHLLHLHCRHHQNCRRTPGLGPCHHPGRPGQGEPVCVETRADECRDVECHCEGMKATVAILLVCTRKMRPSQYHSILQSDWRTRMLVAV